VATPAEDEVVFVVDVSSFTENGFVGTTHYAGKPVAIDFDYGELGVFLTHEMAKRLGVKKGSQVSAMVEADKPQAVSMTVACVGKAVRISDSEVYHAVGKEGGAVIRVRKV
jgi:ABC-type lipoprotein release transport system permease subunit